MWIARDEFGVSLHRTEPKLEPVADDGIDPRCDDKEWASDDCFQPNDQDDAGAWLAAELGKDIPVGGKARVRLVLADPEMPLFGGVTCPA